MKLTLTVEIQNLLILTIVYPENMQRVHPASQAFVAKDDTAGKLFASVRKWVIEKVCEKKTYHPENGTLQNVTPHSKTIEVGVRKSAADYMIKIMEHYATAGRTATLVEPYESLCAMLNGKTFEVEDISEDISAPPEKKD